MSLNKYFINSPFSFQQLFLKRGKYTFKNSLQGKQLVQHINKHFKRTPKIQTFSREGEKRDVNKRRKNCLELKIMPVFSQNKSLTLRKVRHRTPHFSKQHRYPSTNGCISCLCIYQGRYKGTEFEFVLLSFCLLPFHFAKDHILYKQKNMLTVLGRKIGVYS